MDCNTDTLDGKSSAVDAPRRGDPEVVKHVNGKPVVRYYSTCCDAKVLLFDAGKWVQHGCVECYDPTARYERSDVHAA